MTAKEIAAYRWPDLLFQSAEMEMESSAVFGQRNGRKGKGRNSQSQCQNQRTKSPGLGHIWCMPYAIWFGVAAPWRVARSADVRGKIPNSWALFRSQGDNQLLCCVAGDGRHAGGPLCDDIQRLRGTVRWKVDVRTVHVQCVQQPGCLLFHGEHTAPVLHIGGQVSAQLCHHVYIKRFKDNCGWPTEPFKSTKSH